MNRCHWVNNNNPLYVSYHDNEWGKPCHDERLLLELLILESFQAGLSWECILNKRDAFQKAYDYFQLEKIIHYDSQKIEELLNNPNIVRNKLKVKASIQNAKIFQEIEKEFGSFDTYIWSFTNHKVIFRKNKKDFISSPLSDKISEDLKRRGMKFVGTVIIYSYLQAIGVINDHDFDCDFKE